NGDAGQDGLRRHRAKKPDVVLCVVGESCDRGTAGSQVSKIPRTASLNPASTPETAIRPVSAMHPGISANWRKTASRGATTSTTIKDREQHALHSGLRLPQ